MNQLVVAQARQRLAEGVEATDPTAPLGRAPTLPVLLVEHSLLLAKPLLRGLAEDGIVAHLARNDAEGDLRARSTRYAALVVDWHIPRTGGPALIRGWRHAGLAVPVLLFLASPRDAERRQGLEAGADELLPLPFSIAELVARLQAWTTPPGGGATAPWSTPGGAAIEGGRGATAVYLEDGLTVVDSALQACTHPGRGRHPVEGPREERP